MNDLNSLATRFLALLLLKNCISAFPKARKASLSRLRADLVQRSTLAEIARELDLGGGLKTWFR